MSCPFHQLSCKLRVSRTSYSLIAITITFYMCRLLMSLRYSVPQVPQMCDMYPDIGDVGYVVKTGATELSRLEASWSTSLKCVRDLMILSDLEQSFMDHVVHDVLDMVPQSVTESNPDFDLYRQQRRLKSQNRDHEINVALAALFAPSAHPHHREKNSAWVLDKYKFLHMIERAYQLQPGRKWYLFLETDTYLFWSNFRRWIATLDPKVVPFVGHALPQSGAAGARRFAQGGSGFLLSGKVVEEFAALGIASAYDRLIHQWVVGDAMLADVLHGAIGVDVADATPMLIQNQPATLPFSAECWCQPPVTLHHVDPASFQLLYRLERQSTHSTLLLRDLLPVAFQNGGSSKANWDNVADAAEFSLPTINLAIESGNETRSLDPNADFVTCRMACEGNPECFQFFFRNTTIQNDDGKVDARHECRLSRAFRLGLAKSPQAFLNPEEPGTFRSWTSGWVKDRINGWVSANRECPRNGRWVSNVELDQATGDLRVVVDLR